MKVKIWYMIKKFIPNTFYSDLVKLYFSLKGILYSGKNIECPCCKRKFRNFTKSGKHGACPGCGASSRHRNLYYFLEYNKNILNTTDQRIIHFAPENGSIFFFSKLNDSCDYVTADLNSPRAKLKIDITQIPFENNSFDIVLSVHVLEHVTDEKKAMQELFRILKPGGYSVHQVPIDYDRENTYEDKNINTNELREKIYGHPDHKRIYGRDYIDKLRQAGFTVDPMTYIKQLPENIVKKYGLNPSEVTYLCTKSGH